MEEKRSLFGARPDDKPIGVDGSCPKPLHKVPSEMIVCDQMREYIVHDLAVSRTFSSGDTQARTRDAERWRRSGSKTPLVV